MPIHGEMTAPDTLVFGPDEADPSRPFTAVELKERDLSVLQDMLDDLESVLREVDSGTRVVEPRQRIAWRVDGLTHRLLICDETRLRAHPDLCVVGFFGERNTELDMGPLEKANSAIVKQFDHYPGILSYSSVELEEGYWANMVLHDDPVDRDYWRKSALHAQAVNVLSPVHYRNVRIHNARLTAHVLQDPSFAMMKTKYWDYTGEEEWRAERALSP